MQPIETDRLILRAIVIDDAKALESVFCDHEVMEYSDGVKTPDWVRDFCGSVINDWYPNWNSGPYAVADRKTGEVIGYCGLFKDNEEICGPSDRELGYRLARSWWGNGLAHEAAKASVIAGLTTSDINRVVAVVDPDNKASIRILEKLRMRQTGTIMLEWYDYPDLFFEITKEELPRLSA